MVKLISKAYKKLVKYFFIIIFAIYKKDIIKKTKKAFKKGSWKVAKSFWTRKEKNCQYGHKQYKNILEDEKERSTEYVKT